MIGPNFMDEIDCGSFFDHIDDFLDFPGDDVDAGLGPSTDNKAFPSIWSTQSDSLPGSDSVFSGNSASDLSAELSVPVSISVNSFFRILFIFYCIISLLFLLIFFFGLLVCDVISGITASFSTFSFFDCYKLCQAGKHPA